MSDDDLQKEFYNKMLTGMQDVAHVKERLDGFLKAHQEWKEKEFEPLQKTVESHERKFWYVGGAATGLSLLGHGVISKIAELFK